MLLHWLPAIVSVFICSEAKFSGKYSSRNYNRIIEAKNKAPPSQKLLDFDHFQYLTKPDSSRICTEDLYLLVMIHSKPENFKERELIRKTWGSMSSINDLKVKITFLMGQYTQSKQEKAEKEHNNSIKSRSLDRNGFFKSSQFQSDRYKVDAVEKLVTLESILHNDIIQGNFDDNPHNLTFKHVMGYRWTREHCQHQPTFVLKTDDNVFVEMYHLLSFLTGVYGDNPGPSLVCDVIPAGTAPHAIDNQNIIQESFNQQLYPKYCSGSAYLITPSLIPAFLKATGEIAPVVADDVYMTGIVREYLGISPFYLNLRYTYELDRPYKWLVKKNLLPLPFLFVVSDSRDKRSWSDTVRKLWRKTLLVQQVQSIR